MTEYKQETEKTMTYDVSNPGNLGKAQNVAGKNLLMGSQSLPLEDKGVCYSNGTIEGKKGFIVE
jgi:hypothetical protein